MKKMLFGLLGLLVTISGWSAETNSGPISSVTVTGLVAQNGTSTPNTPIDIVSNNGVLKVNTNLYWTEYKDSRFSQYDGVTVVANNGVNVSGMVDCRTVKSFKITTISPQGIFRIFKYRTDNTFIDANSTENIGDIITLEDNVGFFRIQYNYTGVGTENILIYNSAYSLNEIYTDGTVETIADSANHTATVATLLGVGDYRDTQNINTGAITRNVGVKVLNGTENWSDFSSYYALSVGNIATGSILCTHFQNDSNFGIIVLSARFRAYVASIYTTLDSWKQWLAEQYAAGTPVIVLYPLATPTTESVAGQTMTTAPVNNRTGGVTGMTITTLLSSGASVVTTIATNAIKIATTAYNSARFSPVVTELNTTIATIRDVVTNTINQTKAIADLQATKQTRPDEQCPAGKKCLLVETEENGVIVPHWYEIIENAD